MNHYPAQITQPGHVEPAPRRIRAYLDGQPVLDTIRAYYVWEWANYPQYYVPIGDIRAGLLVDEDREEHSQMGSVEVHGLRGASSYRPRAAKVLRHSPVPGLRDTVRIDWNALDAWFEEDEQVFVHPRSPYVRVDALRSSRSVRIEAEGVVLAESTSAVLVFETGLPTRYYVDRTHVDFSHLVPTDTITACPYKGVTTCYWSARVGDTLHRDLAWSYDFPTRQLLPIAGLISFYNEKVDITVDGVRLEQPVTHFFRA